MDQSIYSPIESTYALPDSDSQITSLFTNYRYAILFGGLLASIGIGLVAAFISPIIAIAIIFVGTLAFIAFLRPEMTTVFIAFAFYANLPVVATRFGVPAAIASSIFLALGLPMLYSLLVKRDRLVINTGLVMMLAYFAILLLSAIFSQDFTLSIDRIVNFAIEGFVLYFLFINTIRSPKTIKWVIWAVIASGILMGTLSIIQEVTGNYENDFLGMAQTKDDELSVGAVNFFDDKPTARRLAGPIGSKNRYAQIMVVLFPLVALRIWAESNKTLKLIAFIGMVPIIAGALLTYSRGAGLTLIAILAAMMLLRLLPIWKTIIYGIIAYMLIALVLPGFAYRFASVADVSALFTGEADEADGAIRGRATVNLVGIEIIKMQPLLGVGPGQSRLYARAIGNEVGFRWLTSDRRLHNMYLEEAADTGLIGFGMFMAIVLVTLYKLNKAQLKWRNKNPEYYYTILSVILALFAYLVTAVFLHLSYVRYYWFLLALAGATAYVYLHEPVPEITAEPEQPVLEG